MRLLAAVGVLLIAVLQMLANFVPGRLTPFGAPEDEPESWIFLVLNLVISLLLANGLRKGYKLAWRFAIILPTLLVLVVLLLLVVAVISVFAPDADIELIGMPQIIASSCSIWAYWWC